LINNGTKDKKMEEYYKRNISLMDKNFFSRNSLDKSIDNPDAYNSIEVDPTEKSDKEIVDNVVSSLRKMGTRKIGTK
jgi:hypothetical protein